MEGLRNKKDRQGLRLETYDRVFPIQRQAVCIGASSAKDGEFVVQECIDEVLIGRGFPDRVDELVTADGFVSTQEGHEVRPVPVPFQQG